ncbi:MAG: outer membrane beta-barrel domain-containing protein [Myxococcota bacterium]|nr:outer membrane beta-barrel domain-containing protein [Myxococcota bacterium]
MYAQKYFIRLPTLVAASLTLAYTTPLSSEAQPAQKSRAISESTEDQDKILKDKKARPKLADRIKSVQRKAFLKKKRVELFPFFAMNLNDPFYQHFVGGAALAFHLKDSFALELKGGAVVGTISQDAVKLVRVNEGAICEDCPQMKYHIDANLGWAPIYGKISLLGESIIHFDTYFTAGLGAFATDSGMNPAVNFGIGQRYFLNDWLVGRVEIRDYVFNDSRDQISDLQNVLMLSLSLSGFFPTSFQYEFR